MKIGFVKANVDSKSQFVYGHVYWSQLVEIS